MHLLALERERGLQQRHVVFEADEAAERPEGRPEHPEVVGIPAAPEDPLLVRGHQLAVAAEDLAVGAEKQHGVVERLRARTVVLLVQPDHRGEPRRAGRAAELLGLRPGDPHRLLVERDDRLLPDRGRLGVRVTEVVPPVGIRRDPRLRGDDEVHPAPAGLDDGLRVLPDTGLLVHEDRADLGRAGAQVSLVGQCASSWWWRSLWNSCGGCSPPERQSSGQLQMRFRSPRALSTRDTGGQYLFSATQGAGKAASSRR